LPGHAWRRQLEAGVLGGRRENEDRGEPDGAARVQFRVQRWEAAVLGWLRRRRMSEGGRRRLVIALARAEEELVETHVRNALEVFEAVGEEMPLDHALELYLDTMDVVEPRASIVGRRVMARLEAGARTRRGRSSRRED
jgi:hypothetical protein